MARKNKSAVVVTTNEDAAVVTTNEDAVVVLDAFKTASESVVEQPSMLASMLQQEVKPLDEVKAEDKPATVQGGKNVGVGQFVRKLIDEGLANKDILKIVHEQYGNKQTTYACVAWYRNKMKKAAHAKVQSAAVAAVTKMLEGETKTEETPAES